MSGSRDKAFEDALRATMAGGAEARGDCPEAEILAAWLERSLAPEEHRRWDDHVAVCLRCQEGLAAIVRSETAADAERAAERGPSWLRGWLAPAALAATAVVALVVSIRTVPELGGPAESPLVLRAPENVAPANERERRRDESAARPAAQPKKTEARQRAAADESGELAGLKSESPVFAETRQARPMTAPEKGAAKMLADGEAKSVLSKESRDAVRDDRAPQALAATTAPQAEEPREPPAAAGALTDAPKDASAVGASKRSAWTPFGDADEMEPVEEDSAEPAPAPVQSRGERQGDGEESGGRMKRGFAEGEAARGQVAVAPEGGIRYRIDEAGRIERSADSGAAWERQETGATGELLSVSAPSGAVCWASGRNGLLLRTLDGESWERLEPPDLEDLVEVTAAGADEAIVRTAGGRRYRTDDAGSTWTPLTGGH